MIDRSTAPLEMFGEPDDTECPHGIPTGMGVECWECRYDQLKIDYDALERERDELQAKVIEQDDKLCKAEKRLEVACHVKADDKVGFDFAVLDKIDSLEQERDKVRNIVKFLEERLRHYYKVMEKRYNRIEDLESENALLRKRMEPIEQIRGILSEL